MDISKAIERNNQLKERLKRLSEAMESMGKDGYSFAGQISWFNSNGGYVSEVKRICFSKEQAMGFLALEIEQINAELEKMKPVFDVANQALKSIFTSKS